MREKLKLLYIVEAMGGGVFTYIVDLANELVEDFDMYVAYAIRPQTPQDYISYFDARIHLIKVENFVRSINAGKDLKAFFEIKKIVKEIKPDIIHLHSSKAGALGRWAFNGHKIPMFYTPHGYSFLMRDYSSAKRIVFKCIEIISAKRFCTTISCSEGEHQETLKFTNHATYVDNGINIFEMDRQLEGCLLYTSRCVYETGVTPEGIIRRMVLLQEEADKKGIPVKLFPGNEIFYRQDVYKRQTRS